MAKTVTKTLSYPLAGIARRDSYRKQPRPYATPFAYNVRGVGSLERRERGGSRPGLIKFCSTGFGPSEITAVNSVTAINAKGERVYLLIIVAGGALHVIEGDTASLPGAELLWDDGKTILWDDGKAIVFESMVSESSPVGTTGAHQTAERAGKLYLADSTLRFYDPLTGIVETVTASAGSIPASCPLICVYRDRLILAKDHLWYASRTSDPTDWAFGATMEDTARAVAGATDFAGMIGEPIKAVIPFRDQYLIFACENSMWVLKGDPATGVMKCVSQQVGIISPLAWALSPDGLLCFLSNDGVYLGGVGEVASRFSAERIPEELRNVSPTSNKISMGYNSFERGFHLFVSASESWFLDIANKAIWKDTFAEEHFPVAVAYSDGDGLRELILGCTDGYLRKFSPSSITDDGIPFPSTVVLGPFRISSSDVTDAVLAEIHGILADNSNTLRWYLFAGNSAEECVDKTESIHNADRSGIWTSDRNKVARTRCRGAWFAIRVEGYSLWSYEAIAVVGRQLGRLR